MLIFSGAYNVNSLIFVAVAPVSAFSLLAGYGGQVVLFISPGLKPGATIISSLRDYIKNTVSCAIILYFLPLRGDTEGWTFY
jgi:hypothetical protein